MYLPLLDLFHRLRAERVSFRIALSLSPTLLSMLADPLLKSRYEFHLENLIRLSDSECRRTIGSPVFAPLARMYRERFLLCRDLWRNRFRTDLIGAFRSFEQTGHMELITTAATHGFLPLMEVSPEAIRAQVEVGCRAFEEFVGRRPDGFWLPECGYIPAVDQALARCGIRYTFLETHGIAHADPAPPFGPYAPIQSPGGVVLFGRDPETARQVWSGVEGYPGDSWYRDFYRDIGFDLDEEAIRPFLYHGGIRTATGMKYYRITSAVGQKEPYDPGQAQRRVQEHADHFAAERLRQARQLSQVMRQPPLIVAMYDAELFGHWWFEGIPWLELVIRDMSRPESPVRLTAPADILRAATAGLHRASPHLSTWGLRGYNEMWLQESNASFYRHLHQASRRMKEVAAAFPSADGLTRRLLNQAVRELLLAQSSDWAFIVAEKTAEDYARWRFNRHISRFTRIIECVSRHEPIDEEWLKQAEKETPIFPSIDYRIYREDHPGTPAGS